MRCTAAGLEHAGRSAWCGQRARTTPHQGAGGFDVFEDQYALRSVPAHRLCQQGSDPSALAAVRTVMQAQILTPEVAQMLAESLHNQRPKFHERF